MKKTCRKGCGHLVGGGGDAHRLCPPRAKGANSERRNRRRLEAIRQKRDGDFIPQRGTAVAGVGGSKAGKHRQKKSTAA